jgi:predicted lipoprotein with Yx(FWY)xxD motif
VKNKRHHRLARLLGAGAVVLLSLGAVAPVEASAATGAGGTSIKTELGSIGTAKATGKTISLAKGKAGIFVIGPNGHSLYVYDKDKGTKTACTGSCASYWPALTSSGTVTTGTLIKKSQVTKVNGQKANQIAYYGHLLYYFSGDTAPGQTNGTSIAGWHLLGPFGNVMLPR